MKEIFKVLAKFGLWARVLILVLAVFHCMDRILIFLQLPNTIASARTHMHIGCSPVRLVQRWHLLFCIPVACGAPLTHFIHTNAIATTPGYNYVIVRLGFSLPNCSVRVKPRAIF